MGLEAQQARVGQVVGPVKTAQGYSVFKVLGKTPARPLSFAESKIRAASHLRQDLAEERFAELIKQLNRQYADRVEIYEGHLAARAGKK